MQASYRAVRRLILLGAVTLALLLVGCSLFAHNQPTRAPLPSRLAFVGTDGHVYSTLPDGSERRRLSTIPGETGSIVGQRLARWPAWSPDGSKLAFMRAERTASGDDTSAVFIVDGDASPTRVFESRSEPPIYLSWAPDSGHISILTGGEQSLTLRMVSLDDQGTPVVVAQGNPLYSAWAPDASALLLHIGSGSRPAAAHDLSIASVGRSSLNIQRLAVTPTDFRAPAWSSDGSMAFAVTVGGQTLLSVQRQGASAAARVATLGPEPVFLWSPGGDHLAVSSRSAGQPLMYQGVDVIKSDGSERTRVTDQEVAAYFWSPDGKRLAFTSLDPNQRALAWFVCDADGKNRRQIATYLPTDDQVFLFAFFDQFAQSHAVWSPDGRYIVYAGALPGPVSANPDDNSDAVERGQIFIATVDGNVPPRAIADGSIALWPVFHP
ncbi:MAG: PD40 domain-containing protein [Chloroflexi bacterium]|nr:PD40 domain-containing protein [Chloroflexota bacterium]